LVANSTLDLLTWPWTQPEFYKVGNSLKSPPLGRVLDTSVDIYVDTRLNWVGIKMISKSSWFSGQLFLTTPAIISDIVFQFSDVASDLPLNGDMF
jgi:hypothetical protein